MTIYTFADAYLTGGAKISDADLRTFFRDRLIPVAESVSEFRTVDYGLQKRVYVASLGALFTYNASSTAADDGVFVLHDSEDRRYLREGSSTTYVRPEDFGAVGDGVNDDTAAVSAAFNSGYPVRLLGIYRITSSITAAAPLYVTGFGRALSQILLDAANVGISITVGTVDNPWGDGTQAVVLRDFGVVPASTSTIAAVKISGRVAIGSSEKTFFIQNVDIVPDDDTHYTAIGFEFFDCRNSILNGCVINGDYGSFAGSGVKWHGSTASAPVELKMSGCNVNWWGKGVELAPNSGATTTGANDWQGIQITDNTFVACDYGIHATTVDNFAEWLSVLANHFNCRTACVWAPDVGHLKVTGNYMLFLGTAPGGTSYGVYTLMNDFSGYKAQYGQIRGNSINFSTTTTTSRVGIYARTGGTNMLTTIRDNPVIGHTVEIDSSPSNHVTPANPVTPVATTSGTAHDFSVPGGVKKVEIDFENVSLSGAANLLIQLGDSGGVETTGYSAFGGYIASGVSPVLSGVTTGFPLIASLASRAITGVLTLTNMSGNMWIGSFIGREVSGSVLLTMTGDKTLSDVLTTVRITSSNGTDTFDSGSVKIRF